MRRLVLCILLAASACSVWPPAVHAQPAQVTKQITTVEQLLMQQLGLPNQPQCIQAQTHVSTANTPFNIAKNDPARFYFEVMDTEFGNCLVANSAGNASSALGRFIPPAGGDVVQSWQTDFAGPTSEQWISCANLTFVDTTSCDLY